MPSAKGSDVLRSRGGAGCERLLSSAPSFSSGAQEKNSEAARAASEFSIFPCRGLLHCARGSFLFFGQAVDFIYVHASGAGIHDGMNRNAMADEGLHRIFIVNGVDFFAVFVNEDGMLAGVQAFFSTCLVPRSSALDAAF